MFPIDRRRHIAGTLGISFMAYDHLSRRFDQFNEPLILLWYRELVGVAHVGLINIPGVRRTVVMLLEGMGVPQTLGLSRVL